MRIAEADVSVAGKVLYFLLPHFTRITALLLYVTKIRTVEVTDSKKPLVEVP